MIRKKTRNTPSSPIEADTDTDETSTESTITPEFFKNSLEELKVELFKKFESQKSEIIEHLTNENLLLKAEIVTLKDLNSDLNKKVSNIEVDVVNLQQYIRRNNI